MILDKLIQMSQVQRLEEIENRSDGVPVKGDFEGNVVAYWVRLEQNGGATVSYQNKEYLTKPIGITSMPAGAEVELSFANGIYFSKF